MCTINYLRLTYVIIFAQSTKMKPTAIQRPIQYTRNVPQQGNVWEARTSIILSSKINMYFTNKFLKDFAMM